MIFAFYGNNYLNADNLNGVHTTVQGDNTTNPSTDLDNMFYTTLNNPIIY
jgi:hypothetical protein